MSISMRRQALTGSKRSTSVASQTTQQSSGLLRRPRGAPKTSTLRIRTATSSASAGVQGQSNHEGRRTKPGPDGASPLNSVLGGDSTAGSSSPPVIRRPGLLQRVALPVTVVAAVGSVAFQLYAGRHSPQHLVPFLIAGWVLSPFVALALLSLLGKRWAAVPQGALHATMLLVSVGSLGIYSMAVLRPLVSKPPAFVFVAVPPASLVLAAIVLIAAWLVSRVP